jgi:hypothetical protein
MATVARTDATTDSLPPDPAYTQQLARLRISLALDILATIAEHLRETAQTFAGLSDDELADSALRAVRAFSEAEHLIGEMMNNAASRTPRAA